MSLIAGGAGLRIVACSVGVLRRWNVGARAAYEELIIGPTGGASVERGEAGCRKAGIVAAIETGPPCAVSDGALRGRGDRILRRRHMAVSARVVSAKRHVAQVRRGATDVISDKRR